MITKILFTGLIIFLMFLVIKKQTAERRPQGRSTGTSRRTQQSPFSHEFQKGAYAFLGLMLLASAVFIFFEWRDQYRVIDVHVINSQTGEKVIYQAHLGDIEGRSFETVEGRQITVADVERIEVAPGRKD